MSDLRSLFPDTRYTMSYPSNTYGVVYVYNTNTNSVQNGGQCCAWTVPANVCWAKFEVWGAGGDGGGGCCCQQPSRGGGSGSYARKTIRVTPGTVFTLCAAGSGCCAVNCGGTQGFPSYACNASASPQGLCLCASGGIGGASSCFFITSGCLHCSSIVCGCACGHDFAICGVSGSAHEGSGCGYDAWQYAPQAPVIGGGVKVGMDHCVSWMGCCAIGGSSFPAGGGGSGLSHGGCCWGSWGAGGLVVVTYK